MGMKQGTPDRRGVLPRQEGEIAGAEEPGSARAFGNRFARQEQVGAGATVFVRQQCRGGKGQRLVLVGGRQFGAAVVRAGEFHAHATIGLQAEHCPRGKALSSQVENRNPGR